MLRKYLHTVVVGMLVTQVMSCATMLTGRYNEVAISTNPPNARILNESGKLLGVTPTKFTIRKKDQPIFRLVHENFKDTTIVLKKRPNSFYVVQSIGWYFWYTAVSEGYTPLDWAKFVGKYGISCYVGDRILGGAWEHKPNYLSGGVFVPQKQIDINMQRHVDD